MARARRIGSRAERTRERILDAAEDLFAEKGFAAARLEDVGARVGVRRAALFYYFRDKQGLYRAVLDRVFGDLLARVREVLAGSGPLPERIEAVVSAWVAYVAERPSLARILLREAADASQERRPTLQRLARPFLDLAESVFSEGRRLGLFRPPTTDPLRWGSSLVGSTVFYVAAVPVLVPDAPYDPLAPERIEEHRQDLLRITRRLLGLPGPRPARRRTGSRGRS